MFLDAMSMSMATNGSGAWLYCSGTLNVPSCGMSRMPFMARRETIMAMMRESIRWIRRMIGTAAWAALVASQG